MSKYITCKMQLFDLKQKVNVYIDNQIEKTVECTIDEIAKVMYELCKEYDIEEIKLNGNVTYCMKLQDTLITDYNKDIPIHITFCS